MRPKVFNKLCAAVDTRRRLLGRRRWQFLGIVLGVIAIVAGFVAWWINARSDDGSWDRVLATGVLRVGLDASFPPFEMLDASGQVTGYDADLAHALAERLGARTEFVNIGYDALYDALLAERVDVVISSLPYDERRTQDIAYTMPYFNAGQQILMRAAEVTRSLTIDEVSQRLAGQTIAVEWGSLADMEARRLRHIIPDLRIVTFSSAYQALVALAGGRTRAAITDGVSAQQFLCAQPSQLHIAMQLTDEPYVVATMRRARRLAAAIEQALEELRQAGRFEALQVKWFRPADLALE